MAAAIRVYGSRETNCSCIDTVIPSVRQLPAHPDGRAKVPGDGAERPCCAAPSGRYSSPHKSEGYCAAKNFIASAGMCVCRVHVGISCLRRRRGRLDDPAGAESGRRRRRKPAAEHRAYVGAVRRSVGYALRFTLDRAQFASDASANAKSDAKSDADADAGPDAAAHHAKHHDAAGYQRPFQHDSN